MKPLISVGTLVSLLVVAVLGLVMANASPGDEDLRMALEAANPLAPLPASPLGVPGKLEELPNPPTPQTVRLGRWLFFDKRISLDGSVSCASCHRPDHAFSEPTPTSTGIGGMLGGRKSPPATNLAWTLYPHFFWDGRADSLEAQAVGPMVNPIEMGNPDHDVMLARVRAVAGYRPYFKEAFGDEEITLDRIAKALADYERTRMSGNSPWDRWRAKPDEGDAQLLALYLEPASEYDEDAGPPEGNPFKDGPHVSAKVKWGHALFHTKAACNQCHLGFNFTDSLFHNLGVGWDSQKNEFKDLGRYDVTKKDEDRGAFKTPGLRDLTVRGPYMHDGSIATLREVVELYNRGGEKNPWLSDKIEPLNLTEAEIDAIVAFLEALDGEGWQDTAPTAFPK